MVYNGTTIWCGYRGFFDEASEQGNEVTPKGMNLVINTTVPLGSGLSSSSSFVVCSFLATSRALVSCLISRLLVHVAKNVKATLAPWVVEWTKLFLSQGKKERQKHGIFPTKNFRRHFAF